MKELEKKKRKEDNEAPSEERDKTVLDSVLPPQRGEAVLKDLMISHPSMEKRIRSLESLR